MTHLFDTPVNLCLGCPLCVSPTIHGLHGDLNLCLPISGNLLLLEGKCKVTHLFERPVNLSV